MSAALSHSIAALFPADDVAAQEAGLLAVSRACPGLVFHDRAGTRAVRVENGALTTLSERDVPRHLAQSITRGARERFELFEDHGDIVLPGWNPDEHEFELELLTQPRVLGDLDQLAVEVADALADGELDDEDAAFFRVVRDAIEVARAEKLPIVAHW